MDVMTEWFPSGKSMKVYTPLCTDSAYYKELLFSVHLTGEALEKE